jgi:hypothetical protein
MLGRRFVSTALFLCLSVPLSAESRFSRDLPLPDAVAREMHELSRHAGRIFSGQVVSIAMEPDGNAVCIRFRVETAMRGANAGQMVAVREWAGLWALAPRYRLGQRFLLFLYPPSRLGLTSPVLGDRGRLPVLLRGGGRSLPAVLIRSTSPTGERRTVVPLGTVARQIARGEKE